MARIAINGFGRIGRLFFRQAFGLPGLEIVAINDLGDVENLAYLLTYDTVYHRYERKVESNKEKGAFVVDGKEVRVLQVKDPTQLPWKDLRIDIVVEATGLFESFEKASVHLAAGAKRVVLTAPAKDEDGPVKSPDGNHGASVAGSTVLMGVNDAMLGKCAVSSNASCTTNSAAPVIQVLSQNPGILKAVLGTVHAMTTTQNLADGPVKLLDGNHGAGPVRGASDFRRGRSAGANIVPSTTGAATAVTRAIPEFKGKFDGLAYRVPVATGSLSDITFVAKRKTSVEEINEILTRASQEARWRGILAVTRDQLVSSDVIGAPYAAIVDLSFTKVIDGDLVKVLSWYDNEWGYSNRCVDLLRLLVKRGI